jgi:hypothetical protein
VEKLGFASDETYRAVELVSGRAYQWKGRENYVLIDPAFEPVQIYRFEPGVLEKPMRKSTTSSQAEDNAKLFFGFQKQALYQNDILARRQMSRIYQEVIAPKIYSGPQYDGVYHEAIDALARQRGWDSIIEAFIRTPGH